jgi:hypothetical protein
LTAVVLSTTAAHQSGGKVLALPFYISLGLKTSGGAYPTLPYDYDYDYDYTEQP